MSETLDFTLDKDMLQALEDLTALREAANEKALELFEKKYNQPCSVMYTEHIADSDELRDEIHVYVPEYMEDYETAIIYSWLQDGINHWEDDLFGYIIRPVYEGKIADALKPLFADCKVYADFVSSSFDKSLSSTSTLEDAYKCDERMVARVFVFVPEGSSVSDETAEAVRKAVAEANIFAGLTVNEVSAADYDRICRENHRILLSRGTDDSVVVLHSAKTATY